MAVGPPQLRPGITACKPNLAIAWRPTKAVPRKLEVFFNGSVAAGSVDAVVLAVVYVGDAMPALEQLQLLLQVRGAGLV